MWLRFWKALHKLLIPGKVFELESGYNKLHRIRKNLATLKDACLHVVQAKDYSPRDVTGDGKPETFCNMAVQYVAERMGCGAFIGGPLANRMHDLMEMSGEFTQVSGDDAAALAQKGCLVIASRKGERHGHVAVVFPAGPQFSASLEKNVPVVANVGKRNGIMRVSLAFPVEDRQEPFYYFWKPSEA